MAVPVYSTDLATISTCETLGTWVETGTWTTGTAPALEPDFFIQGSNCIAKYWTSGGGGGTPSGAIFDSGSGVTIPSPGAYFVWLFEQCPNNIATEANGGLRAIIGSSATAFRGWYVGGSDTLPYGGWVCIPVDPAVTADVTIGAPTATLQWFGAGVLQTATAKGGLGIDKLMYGRGQLKVEFGSTADGYATFAGAAAQNDSTTNRWGLFQAVPGGYLQQGLFSMGTATNPVDFRDSNKSIVIANTKKVISIFNKFEIRNTASKVFWNSINISSLGTISPGNFDMVDNAPFTASNCTFSSLGSFNLKPKATINNTTFRNCDLIIQSSSIFSGCTISGSTQTVKQLVSNNPSNISNTTFISDGIGHAIEITSPGSYAFAGNIFIGFGASGSNQAAIYNNSGAQVTMSITSGGSTPTFRNGPGSKTRIDSNVSITLTGLINPSEVRVFYAGTTTEIAGQENVTSGTFVFAVASGQQVDISILSLNYQILRIKSYSTTSDTSLPIQQQIDRQYQNP